MSSQNKSLQDPVRIIAIFVGCLTLVVGVSAIVHGGDLEISIVGIVVNLSIYCVLFYGAKKKDTTHIVVWLAVSLAELGSFIIGICYFAYESEKLRLRRNSEKEPIDPAQAELVFKLRVEYIVYSAVSGVLTIFLCSIMIVVKKFHNELLRSENCQEHGR